MGLFFDQYARDIITYYDLQKKSENEFGSRPCPNCGGVDRFYINEYAGKLKHHCRQMCDFVERNSAFVDLGLLPKFDRDTIPYSTKKQLPLLGGAFLDKNNVVIPIRHVVSNDIVGKQIIYPDGGKKFEKGTKKAGAGAYIGEPSEVLYLCES